jgi:hypothetical protein
MSDIVERLNAADISGHGKYSVLVRDAKAEIERLRADVADGLRRELMLGNEAAKQALENKRLRALLSK